VKNAQLEKYALRKLSTVNSTCLLKLHRCYNTVVFDMYIRTMARYRAAFPCPRRLWNLHRLLMALVVTEHSSGRPRNVPHRSVSTTRQKQSQYEQNRSDHWRRLPAW